MRGIICVAAAFASLFLAVQTESSSVSAQTTDYTVLTVWGPSHGIKANAKVWKVEQSSAAGNSRVQYDVADNLGTAQAAAVDLDDSNWEEIVTRWVQVPGSNVSNHFRKSFTLEEVGVKPWQVVGMRVQLQYDDTAIMYLDGEEVYRSIRGNLDPLYETYPKGDDLPYDAPVPYGGLENEYIHIPDPHGYNERECPIPCADSPYKADGYEDFDVPAVSVEGLKAGTATQVHTWAVTTWNNSVGGSGDSSFNHVFELLIDSSVAEPAPIVINEVMASNDRAVPDDRTPPRYPDWIELYNSGTEGVDLTGWVLSDSSASWTMPALTIEADGYLLLYASDCDPDRETCGTKHTNFALSKEGDSLTLSTNEGYLVDQYSDIPRQITDLTYGRVADSDELAYLLEPTPGEVNSAAGSSYEPILRLFADRIYNKGETVDQMVDAFDPDGDELSYSISGASFLSIDSESGAITGTASSAGTFTSVLTVSDSDGDSVSQTVEWIVIDPPESMPPILLNEYNAVADGSEHLSGSAIGNGGDWFEFIVTTDKVDLRGLTFEFYDRKGDEGQLRRATSIEIGSHANLARVPAGTLLTFSEQELDDVGFDGDTDWTINFNVAADGSGDYFEDPDTPGVFNSTREGQVVIIRDANGNAISPAMGETEAWDSASGGVSGTEVMSLCIVPDAQETFDPVTSYLDNGSDSSIGQPNECLIPDPDDASSVVEFQQDLDDLRGTAGFGRYGGDLNCDAKSSMLDALLVARFAIELIDDDGPCFFEPQAGHVHGDAGDVNRDGKTSMLDALLVAQCAIDIENPYCASIDR